MSIGIWERVTVRREDLKNTQEEGMFNRPKSSSWRKMGCRAQKLKKGIFLK